MNNFDYHAHPAVSKSHLDAIGQSPLHYWCRFLDPNRVPPQPTPAMEFGSAVHAAVLEPEVFAAEYAKAPDLPKTTKAGKEAWAAAAQPGIKLLKSDEWSQIQSIEAALSAHPMASKVLQSPGRSEASFFAIDPATDLEIKCRPDHLTDSGWVIDLKTTQDASLAGFGKSIANFRYHVQAAHYLTVLELATGIRPKGFIFVAVEKTYPFAIQVFKCSDDLIAQGTRTARANLEALRTALSTFPLTTPWPSYSNQMTEINLPIWARN